MSARVRDDRGQSTWPTQAIRVRKWAPPLSSIRKGGGYAGGWAKAVTISDMRPGRTYMDLLGRVVLGVDRISITSGDVGIIRDQEGLGFGGTVKLQLS